ncbi:hypothetical protein GMAR_ORF252 [Golden Marseillevirus]|uniref:hypothetical protein n=1 Tax=Golden Marseillevirus TaxID=1720526 RepID=UPI000877A948|nr:hypothetical protein GMAR_ORF252 [Golden Marseillevirus]ALX27626.1 hypothetical protein GMAR_ORF252 [Golden Marseillevirus]
MQNSSISVLPPEVMCEVFSFFTFGESCVASLVCREFYGFFDEMRNKKYGQILKRFETHCTGNKKHEHALFMGQLAIQGKEVVPQKCSCGLFKKKTGKARFYFPIKPETRRERFMRFIDFLKETVCSPTVYESPRSAQLYIERIRRFLVKTFGPVWEQRNGEALYSLCTWEGRNGEMKRMIANKR